MVKIERSQPAPKSLAEEKTKVGGVMKNRMLWKGWQKIFIINAIFVKSISCKIRRSNI